MANAIGSVIAQVSGEVEQIFALDDNDDIGREEALNQAKQMAIDEAVAAGADQDSCDIVDVEDIPFAYLPGNATNIRVKAAGTLVRE